MIGRIRTAKRQGEFAELKFQVAAASQGLAVAKPYGDSMPYDFIVDNGKRLLRVQVKSVSTWRQRAYKIATRAHGKFGVRVKRIKDRRYIVYPISTHLARKMKSYTEAEADFVAALVIPEDRWYVIPVSALRGRVIICVFPNNPASKGMFERYREAWELLQ